MTPADRESLRDVIRGAAATLLLFLAYTLVPLFGAPAGIITPYPAVISSLKGGRTAGVAVVLLAAAVLALTDLSVGLLYLVQTGLLSLLLPEFLRRGWGGARSIAASVATVAVMVVAGATGYSLWRGIDLTAVARKGIAASITQTVELYRKSGLSGEQLTAVQEALKQGGALIALVYPALLVLFMLFMAGMTMALVSRNAGKLVAPPRIGRFAAYRNPDHLIWLVIVSGFSLLINQQVVFQIALNVLIVTLALYFVQGMAIIVTVFNRFAVSSLMRGIFYLLLAVQPYLAIGVVLLGLFDLWLNFRTPKQGENL